MFSKSTVQVWAIVLLLSAGVQPATAQAFWSETFPAQHAAQWKYSGNNHGLSRWTWTDDPAAGFQDPDLAPFAAPTVTDGYFYFDSHNNGLVPHDVLLTGTGNTANCSGKTGVRLRFFAQYIYFNPGGSTAELGMSTDGVNFTYKTLFAGLPPDLPYHGPVEVALPEADNQAQVWIRFRWTGYYEYHWKIDDLALFVPCDGNPSAILCDNFDTYDPALKLGPQAGHWTTISGMEGGEEDGMVSTERVNTAPNALKINSTDSSGGPQHVVLDLGNRAWGRYDLRWKMYIPEGKQGYFNLQNAVPADAGNTNLSVTFEPDHSGRVRLTPEGAVLREFVYPYGKWFDVQQVIDLNNNLVALFVDNQFVLKRAYTKNLGGVEFSGYKDQNLYFIDDLYFLKLPALVFNPDSCETAVDISQVFGQAPGIAQITGLFDNTDAGVSSTDPEVDCWSEAGPGGLDILNNTLWFTFTGDGSTYDIQTVPCNATHYIGVAQGNKGDTQMLVFAGDNCTDLSPVLCNDDLFLTGQPDFRAGVTLETQSGRTYYLLIDGFENQGVAATGEFCIQAIQKPSVPCNAGKTGTFALANSGYLCANEKLTDILTVDDYTFSIPTKGPQFGLSWCFTPVPAPPGAWPGGISGVASTPLFPAVSVPPLHNNGQTLDFSTWYLTPVVLGGGTLINPDAPPYIFNINPDSGCYFTGPSLRLTLLPPLAALAAFPITTMETVPPGHNGAINLSVAGGAAAALNNPSLYHFEWSNSETSEDIAGLAAGIYTVTISDATGCAAPLTLSVTVPSNVVNATDPGLVRSLMLHPNPARDAVSLQLTLGAPAAVRVELLGPMGQLLQQLDADAVQTLSLPLDLSGLPDGIYLLRVRVGDETAWRRLVVQH